MERVILHCDMNNFYASVECLSDAALKNVPLAVAGDKEQRHGIVLAKNEIAKSYGIKTGDVIWEAKQKCPSLTVVKPNFDKYMYYSKRAHEIYSRFTSCVEPFGADECWLDCTGSLFLFQSGQKIADSIRQIVKDELGLTLSAGVSFNKVFAKLGSDLKKPDATTLIGKDDYKEKIFHLRAGEMLGVGKKTAQKLEKLNIFTIGDLANADAKLLVSHFGKVGKKMYENANGQDNESVRESSMPRTIKSVGHGMTASKDITTTNDAVALIGYLADMVATRLRKYGVKGRGVALSLRFLDLSHCGKQISLSRNVFTAKEISAAATEILRSIWDFRPLRAVTIAVFNLEKSGLEQIGLFDLAHDRAERLEQAMDKIRTKHGSTKIITADLLKSDFIYDKTESEDFLPFYRGD